MYKESPIAYVKRALADLTEVEQRLLDAITQMEINQKHKDKASGSFHLKRAATVLQFVKENVDSALNGLYNEKAEKEEIKSEVVKSNTNV